MKRFGKRTIDEIARINEPVYCPVEICPTPSDLGDYIRYCPIDPYTGNRGDIYLLPDVAQRLNEAGNDSGLRELYNSLSESEQINFLPSRYQQGYADLDEYSDFLRSVLSAPVNEQSETTDLN